MIDRINRYEKGSIDLLELTEDLEGLLHALENYNEAWKDEFQSIWLNLDFTYSVALHYKTPSDDLKTKNEIIRVAGKLKGLILKEIENTIFTE